MGNTALGTEYDHADLKYNSSRVPRTQYPESHCPYLNYSVLDDKLFTDQLNWLWLEYVKTHKAATVHMQGIWGLYNFFFFFLNKTV